MAIQSSNLIAWNYDIPTQNFHIVFGYKKESDMSKTEALGCVHPEDRQMLEIVMDELGKLKSAVTDQQLTLRIRFLNYNPD